MKIVNGNKKKTWNSHCCSFHVRRLSHCPVLLNGATRKSTPDMNIIHPYDPYMNTIIPREKNYAIYADIRDAHIDTSRDIHRCNVPTVHESCEVSERLEQSANWTPYHYVVISRPKPASTFDDTVACFSSAWTSIEPLLVGDPLGWHTFHLDTIKEIYCKSNKFF